MGGFLRSGKNVAFAALAMAAMMWAVLPARAGAIRHAGRIIAQETNAAAASGATAAGRATSAAKAAPGVLSNAANVTGNQAARLGKTAGQGLEEGAGAAAFGAKAAPGILARKTSSGARTVWHVIW